MASTQKSNVEKDRTAISLKEYGFNADCSWRGEFEKGTFIPVFHVRLKMRPLMSCGENETMGNNTFPLQRVCTILIGIQEHNVSRWVSNPEAGKGRSSNY